MKLAKDKKLWIPDAEMWQNWCLNYEISHWKEVVKHLTTCRTAIDIGAHVGIWSRRMAQIFTTVHAFEPVSKHVECHKENLKLFDNVILHQTGLSDIKSTAVMKELDFNSGTSTLEWKKLTTRPTKHKQRQTTIDLNTLDSYNITDVDFIKIDVEMHEVNVLNGAVKTLTENSSIVFIEILPKQLKLTHNAKDVLKSLGYREIMHVGSGNFIFSK
jgi:FkbM family methyltransferase